MRTPRTILLSLAFLAMAAAWPVRALELGRIQIDSALGEPLRALIPITAYTDAELEQLRPANAAAEAYQLLHLVRRPAIETLTLELDRSGAVPVLRVATPAPVTDPHLDLLLEVRWSAGRVLREYVLLIEPRRVPEPAPIATPMVATGTPVAVEAAIDAHGHVPTTWPVRPGDSLSGIARQLTLPGTSVNQRVLGLYETNPQAFIARDINRLRQSTTLQIPDSASLAAIPEGVAMQRLGELMAGGAVVTGKVTAAAAEAPKLGSARDTVRISQGDHGKRVDNGPSQSQSLEEEVTARAHALAEAEARIAALEKSIQGLQRLLAARQERETLLGLPVDEQSWDIQSPLVLGLLALLLLPALFWGGHYLGSRGRRAGQQPTGPAVVLPGLSGLSLDLAAGAGERTDNGVSLARAHLVLGEREAARRVLNEVLVRGSALDQAEARRMLDALDR